MSELVIPDDVRRLLVGAIGGVPHLEALLLLRADETRGWSPAELARRLYVGSDAAERILADLAAHGFVAKREAGHEFAFAADARVREVIDRLADIYARHVAEVSRILHSKTEKQARQFADAFLLRRDK